MHSGTLNKIRNLCILSCHDSMRLNIPSTFSLLTAIITFHYLSGDDAKSVVGIHLRDVLSLDLAFDHKTIIVEYLNEIHPTIMRLSKNASPRVKNMSPNNLKPNDMKPVGGKPAGQRAMRGGGHVEGDKKTKKSHTNRLPFD